MPTTQMLTEWLEYHFGNPKYYEWDPFSYQKQHLIVVCHIILYPSELSPVL